MPVTPQPLPTIPKNKMIRNIITKRKAHTYSDLIQKQQQKQQQKLEGILFELQTPNTPTQKVFVITDKSPLQFQHQVVLNKKPVGKATIYFTRSIQANPYLASFRKTIFIEVENIPIYTLAA